MDRISRQQHHPRSNSISGEEFHLTNSAYQAQMINNNASISFPAQSQKQPLQLQQSGSMIGALIDLNQIGNRNHLNINRSAQMSSPYRDGIQERSPSPNHSIHMPIQSLHHYQYMQNYQQPLDPRHQVFRNHTHASLECLNTAHCMEQHQQQFHHQPQIRDNFHMIQKQQHQKQEQQQMQQHYAASYVLSTPPANTIINESADQDLAAAAMGNAPDSNQYQPFASPIPYSNSSEHRPTQISQSPYYSSSNILTKAINHMSQSPLRRIGLPSPNATTMNNNSASSGIFNNIVSQSQIRAGLSSLSLASSTLLIEEKLQNEMKKLQSELNSEREKNEALNSQLKINSSLMAAFEQSLTTLNTRLRQLTNLNQMKDQEIEELKESLRELSVISDGDSRLDDESRRYNALDDKSNVSSTPELQQDFKVQTTSVSPNVSPKGCDKNSDDHDESNERKQALLDEIENLKKKLVEKDRQLTDMRLEALSAAHQLEQLESKMNGDNSLLTNEDDLDEGVMVANHSPSDSDAITDPVQLNEINSQMNNISSNRASTRPVTTTVDKKCSEQNQDDNPNAFYNLVNNCSNHVKGMNFQERKENNLTPTMRNDNASNDYQLDPKTSEFNSCNSSFASMSENSKEDVRWTQNY